jgi:drug/metabolite transporter (DMT)-like permease
VLSALHPVVTIGLARIYLHERITRTQTAGIATCIAGVLAVTAA